MMQLLRRCVENSPSGRVHQRLVLAEDDVKALVRTIALRTWCEGVKRMEIEAVWRWGLRSLMHDSRCFDRFYSDAKSIEEGLKIGDHCIGEDGTTGGDVSNVIGASWGGVGR